MNRFAGAVLTGGASRRMGRDKATLAVGGVPMARHVAEVLRGVGVDPIVAIGGDLEALRADGLDVIEDRWPGEGPLGGILTAMRWSPKAHLIVLACDLPWLDGDAVREVLLVDDDAHAVMAFTDRLEPLFAVWDVDHAAPELQAAFDAGVRSPAQAIRGLRVRRVEMAEEAVRDVDRPGDLPPE